MATQQVNASRLNAAGKNLTDLSQRMNKEMKKLDDNISKVMRTWDSDASVSFIKKYEMEKVNLIELVQILQEMGAVLTQFSANYQQADSKAMDLIHKYLKR